MKDPRKKSEINKEPSYIVTRPIRNEEPNTRFKLGPMVATSSDACRLISHLI